MLTKEELLEAAQQAANIWNAKSDLQRSWIALTSTPGAVNEWLQGINDLVKEDWDEDVILVQEIKC